MPVFVQFTYNNCLLQISLNAVLTIGKRTYVVNRGKPDEAERTAYFLETLGLQSTDENASYDLTERQYNNIQQLFPSRPLLASMFLVDLDK